MKLILPFSATKLITRRDVIRALGATAALAALPRLLVFRRLATNSDWLAVLKECPVRMDDVPPRRRELPRRRKL